MFRNIISAVLSTSILFCTSFSISANPIIYGDESVASSENNIVKVVGEYFEFDEDDKFDFSAQTGKETSSGNTYGEFFLNGDITNKEDESIVNPFLVNLGTVDICYKYDDKLLTATDHSWHLIKDSDKNVNGIELDEKINKGAFILQTSFDGVKWVETTSNIKCNVFANTPTSDGAIFTSYDIQQVNGTYFKFIVVYELERKISDDKWYDWLPATSKYETKKCCEVYEFYLIDANAEEYVGSSQSTILGSVVNTGKDNGYSGSKPIDTKDPHYGWDIGDFKISGYTSRQMDTKENVFLKNEGDRVILSFHMNQDINSLNGNDKYIIYSDYNGYDRYFQTNTDAVFGKGTLIVRYTDVNGSKTAPQIYTDYLLACTSTGADTRVQLFEEGDYEVALDYEICDTTGVNSYNNYRIFFKFSIRNGNCIAFLMDSKTNSELDNYSVTPNGFYIDWAKSKYLSISVERKVLNSSGNGLDTRENKPAADGTMYMTSGIYYINIVNIYTKDTSQKIVFVGTDKNLREYFDENVVRK